MKKLIMTGLFAFTLGISAFAEEQVPLTVGIDDQMPIGNGHPKSPVVPPSLFIEDYTLLFAVDHPEYVLNIKDKEGEVVYTTIVTSAETQVTLPSYLAGGYLVELLMGYWKFTGYITL